MLNFEERLGLMKGLECYIMSSTRINLFSRAIICDDIIISLHNRSKISSMDFGKMMEEIADMVADKKEQLYTV